MIITFTSRLDDACLKHPAAEKRLRHWERMVEAVGWKSFVDVRRVFRSADAVKLDSGLVVTVFNIGGNTYRLLTTINFREGIVNVIDVLTHAEYDKEKWKTV